MDSNGKEPNFEAIVRKLSLIIADMESDSIELEPSIKAYEEGCSLLKAAQAYLADAEQHVSILSSGDASDLNNDQD